MVQCLAVCLLGILACIVISVPISAVEIQEDTPSNLVQQVENWQSCSVFMAPSKLGWSVYAARPIKQGEMFQVSPLFLFIEDNERFLRNTILYDYTYSINRMNNDTGKEVGMSLLIFGMGSVFNHNPIPNVDKKISSHPLVGGYVALRDIKIGEELYVTYGSFNHDGLVNDDGSRWFRSRGMEMHTTDAETRIPMGEVGWYKAQFCSKIYAGPGLPTFGGLPESELYPLTNPGLAPFDAFIGDARAKTEMRTGELIEFTIGMLLPKTFVDGTMMAPLVFNFEDFDIESQNGIRILRDSGNLVVRLEGRESGWQHIDRFSGFDHLSILPLGGNIVAVRRVGYDPSSNCRLHISWQSSIRGSAGVTLELIATRNIAPGEILKLNLQDSSSREGYKLLQEELDYQGAHAYSASYFSRQQNTS